MSEELKVKFLKVINDYDFDHAIAQGRQLQEYVIDMMQAAYNLGKEDEWVSVETKRPPYMEFILTWDGTNMAYRCLSKGHDVMPLDEFKERTKITHWKLPQPPTK